MIDSTDANAIPDKGTQATAGYIDGKWQSSKGILARFPHLPHLTIAVFEVDDADCLDIENGDATNATAPAWTRRQHKRGLLRPVLYTSISNVGALVAEMEVHAIHRSEYMIWAAHYTGVPHIESNCEATQYESKESPNIDVSLVYDKFFEMIHGQPKPKPAPPNHWQPADELRWCREFDSLPRGEKSRKAVVRAFYKIRRRVLTRVMKAKALEIQTIASSPHFGGWVKLNRKYRFDQLTKRAWLKI
jgi:hypothetical protein